MPRKIFGSWTRKRPASRPQQRPNRRPRPKTLELRVPPGSMLSMSLLPLAGSALSGPRKEGGTLQNSLLDTNSRRRARQAAEGRRCGLRSASGEEGLSRLGESDHGENQRSDAEIQSSGQGHRSTGRLRRSLEDARTRARQAALDAGGLLGLEQKKGSARGSGGGLAVGLALALASEEGAGSEAAFALADSPAAELGGASEPALDPFSTVIDGFLT